MNIGARYINGFNLMCVMDFGDIESKYSSSNLFNIMHVCENGFSQDAQYRPRKSPRKRLKITRMSTSLVIDQLKSVFWYPDDFMSRVRTRRNWRPEFLMKYFRDNRRGRNEGRDVILQHGKKILVPEAPKIYSIGLHSGARSLIDSSDLSNSCGAITNFKKRFNIVRR
ncbi:uncharacterized protein LOC118647106 [Monomorium pharaonis]|uniref:uncharacterized protein LOC118647106 n=1 Tax=Monomorium pharaonis TaxID=307658 RepID=UPI001745E178|nr:uncharacterized protein LOC118647106 [Monomorium pharaonis]